MLKFGSESYGTQLAKESFWRDSSGQVRYDDSALRRTISTNTLATVAGDVYLAHVFGNGFDAVNQVVALGAGHIAGMLQKVDASLETLKAEWTYGLELLVAQQQAQNQRLGDIVAKLDQIHKTLESPLLTQARELYRIGCERLSKGLLDKALEAFLRAEEKNDTDFFTQFQLGKLYLYGLDNDDNVVEPAKAKTHLEQAVRYAEAEVQGLPEFKRWAGEAGLHLSIACYALANDSSAKGDPAGATELLRQAHAAVTRAVDVYPQLSQCHYHLAKYSILLGDKSGGMHSLERAIELDKDYCLKACTDVDFDSVRTEIAALFEKLRRVTSILATLKVSEVRSLIDALVCLDADAEKAKEAASQLAAKAESNLKLGTYFACLEALADATLAAQKRPEYSVQAHCVGMIQHPGRVLSVTFSDDGRLLATACDDGHVRLWSTADRRLLRDIAAHSVPDIIYNSALSPDGRLVASTSGEETACIWDVASGSIVKTLTDPKGVCTPFAFSRDGRLLATGRNDGSATLWNVEGWHQSRVLTGHGLSGVYAIAFSPDGQFVATGGGDGTVVLWRAETGQLLASRHEHSDRVWSVTFSPDGTYVAAVNEGFTWAVWRIPDMTLVGRPQSPEVLCKLASVCFAGGNALLLMGDGLGCLLVRDWRIDKRSRLPVILPRLGGRAHNDWIFSIAPSPGGSLLASGSGDKTVKLWELRPSHALPGVALKRMTDERNSLSEQAASEAASRRASLAEERRRNGLCVVCGRKLGLLAKLRGQASCLEHEAGESSKQR